MNISLRVSSISFGANLQEEIRGAQILPDGPPDRLDPELATQVGQWPWKYEWEWRWEETELVGGLTRETSEVYSINESVFGGVEFKMSFTDRKQAERYARRKLESRELLEWDGYRRSPYLHVTPQLVRSKVHVGDVEDLDKWLALQANLDKQAALGALIDEVGLI